MAPGVVYLVGAGPGDPGLLTVRGAEVLARADVVVYDGLVGLAVLEGCRTDAERIYAGKKRAPHGAPLDQAAINALLVERAGRGQVVVRLKGGDPFVFGRGAEECLALAAASVRFEIVPGVTAATAVPAYAGIPLTARGVTATVAFATGHEADGKEAGEIDWAGLARAGTVVLFMALRTAEECCASLIAAGRAPSTPAAAIAWGTRAAQRTVVATLADLPAALTAAAVGPPALLVIGEVVTLRDRLAWAERRPLHGRRVAVTRGAADGKGFVRAIAELGGEPLYLPVTRPVGPTAAEAARLADALAHLDRYDWVAFASAQAVDRFAGALAAAGKDARALAGIRLACVGRATAGALRRHGLVADLVPAGGDAAALAAGIAAAPGPAAAGAPTVLLPRAAGGRDEAVHLLGALGARVDAIAIYGSAAVAPDDPALAPGLAQLRRGGVHGLAVFAPSQARALVAALGVDADATLAAVDVVVAVGGTTRRALEALGVRVDRVPAEPAADALAAELARALAGAGDSA